MRYGRSTEIFQTILRKFVEGRLKETSGSGVSNMDGCAEAVKMDCLLYRRR
jgi:hypothetical protein